MSATKALKDAIVQCYTAYKRNKSSLARALPSKNIRTIQLKIKALEEAVDAINAAHTAWVLKAELDDATLAAEKFSPSWLESVWDEADELLEQALDITQPDTASTDPPVVPIGTKLLVLTKQMDSLKINIVNDIEVLLSETNVEKLQSGPHTIYSDMFTKVSSQLESSYKDLSTEILSLSGVNTATVIEDHEAFKQNQHKRLVDIRVNLAKLATQPVTTPPPETSRPTSSVAYEKGKAPTFSGNTLDYPEFKRAWQKVTAAVWDDDVQIEQIKFKVDAHTKLIISRCDTMAEVWKTLDAEYAQEQEVINAVNSELLSLSSGVFNTPEYIMKLRNHLPRLEDALRSVQGLEHLQTPDKVNFLVEGFDESYQRDWEYFKSKQTGPTYDRFFAFILDRYDSCRSTVARIKSRENNTLGSPNTLQDGQIHHSSVGVTCFKCTNWVAEGGSYSCPACSHTASEKQPIGHCLEHCTSYMNMSANQRSDCVKNAKWCPIHLSSTHELDACNQKSNPRLVCGVNGCNKHHHRSLHGSTTPFVAQINALDAENEDIVLLSMQSVSTLSGGINCFFDDGSNRCLILTSTAERLGLVGEEVDMRLDTVIGAQKSRTMLYTLYLKDNSGKAHKIQVFGVPKITGNIQDIDVSGVKTLFSKDVQNNWRRVATRPSGVVELLVGSNYSGLHPYQIEVYNNIKVKKSIFGSGFVLTGSHSALKPLGNNQSFLSSSIDVSVRATNLTFKSVREYLDSYELYVEAPRRCNNCMNCQECTYLGQLLSLRDQYEYQTMLKYVTYDSLEKVFRIRYPFTEDPSILTNNFGQVLKIAEREERKLEKEQLTAEFNCEFDKMLACGALVELSEDDMAAWSGPVHYVSLQHVIKPDSTTTPLRIVTNSSLSDRNGNSLNSILMKGPNSLSDQRDVISRWRCYEVALSSDITKAYFAMKTGELEMHVRRVVWRYGKTDECFRVFGYRTVSFGDKPAGAFLDIVIKKVAEMSIEIDPQAAMKIANDRYVDDIATGGSDEEVKRMAGMSSSTINKFETDGTLSQIFANGTFKLKAVVMSGETDIEKINKLGRSVLGHIWDPTTDTIAIDLRQNEKFYEMLDSLDRDDIILTMRILLGIINKPHDLLGLIVPIVIRLMVAYRDLFRIRPLLGWDEDIPKNVKGDWIELLKIFKEVSTITFPRSTRPRSAVGSPDIVGFFDGSDNAYAAVVYLRWTLVDGSIYVVLAGSKAKVTPLKRISTPRAELNGAVLLGRLALSLVRSCVAAGATPATVWLIGDSECTLASLEKTSGAFGEYFGNRVGDILDNQARIQKHCNVGEDGEWYHTASGDNPADQATRLDSTAQSIGSDSSWQRAPSYLYLAKEQWPINRDFAKRKESCIPDCEILRKYRCLIQLVDTELILGVHNLIDPFFTNDWDVLIHRTQIIIKCVQRFSNVTIDYEAIRLESAENLWFRHAMEMTREAQDKGRLSSLCVEERDGLVVVCGRAKVGLQKMFGKEYLPVLVGKSRVAYLIMLWAHKRNHDARDITMSIACSKAWIVNAKRLATSITDKCVRCRYLHKLKVQQQMAALPSIVQISCPPFTNIGLDLVGPQIVRSMTNKRATMKVWNVIFVCLNTKAVTMYLAPGYATEDFMIAYNSHISDHGLPATVHSDRGSQLEAAGKEVANYDWDAIAQTASIQGTTWDFAPAGAQWRNGAVEIFVKKFKKSFEVLYSHTRLNFAELACAVKRVSNVLNDRPLSVQKSGSEYPEQDFLTPITPNMLITGRNSTRAPIDRDGNFDQLPEERLSYIEELERAWWYQYKVQYFTSLVPRQKWLHSQRNMCPGDVVLIEYKAKSFPGTYRLGRVKAVEVDSVDGLVRTCTVIYKLVKSSTKNSRDIFRDLVTKEVRLPVQRLVLILPIEEQ